MFYCLYCLSYDFYQYPPLILPISCVFLLLWPPVLPFPSTFPNCPWPVSIVSWLNSNRTQSPLHFQSLPLCHPLFVTFCLWNAWDSTSQPLAALLLVLFRTTLICFFQFFFVELFVLLLFPSVFSTSTLETWLVLLGKGKIRTSITAGLTTGQSCWPFLQ